MKKVKLWMWRGGLAGVGGAVRQKVEPPLWRIIGCRFRNSRKGKRGAPLLVKTRLGSGLMRRNASEREPASNRRPSVQNGGWLTPTDRPTAASFLPFRSFGSQTRRPRSTPPAARVLVGGEIKRKLARGRISGEATRRNKTRKHDRTLVPRSFVVFVSLSTAPVFLATN